jgi:formamidopyrimidine-DNA glycosylase
MPELPEVETILRSLAPLLAGRRIERVAVRDSRLREPVPGRRLKRLAVGRRVLGLRRRAKYLLVDLEGGLCLVVHLGMSGRLHLKPKEAPLATHVHVVVALDDGGELRFEDPRRFGLFDIVAASALERDPRFRGLGPEPFSEGCSGSYFFERSRGLRKPIKNFLMDARHVVGVGNIYASEALFLAGVRPDRAAGRLERRSWDRVAAALKRVLEEAIRQGGTTLNDFQDGNGNEGYFQVYLRVYGREGEPCIRCGARVRAMVLAGRSSFFCPRCQR